jgi:hypothetical protein
MESEKEGLHSSFFGWGPIRVIALCALLFIVFGFSFFFAPSPLIFLREVILWFYRVFGVGSIPLFSIFLYMFYTVVSCLLTGRDQTTLEKAKSSLTYIAYTSSSVGFIFTLSALYTAAACPDVSPPGENMVAVSLLRRSLSAFSTSVWGHSQALVAYSIKCHLDGVAKLCRRGGKGNE